MFSPEKAILLVIDIQGKLARLMHQRNQLLRNISTLIQAASILKMPVVLTEQVPEKIGKTVPEIAKLLIDFRPITKKSFSCCGEDRFVQELESLNRKQVIVAGIEAHVCIYQTVCDLLSRNFEIQVVGDAVSSRTEVNKYFGLDRVKLLGGGVSSTEMIICELLKTCEHPQFREVIGLIK